MILEEIKAVRCSAPCLFSREVELQQAAVGQEFALQGSELSCPSQALTSFMRGFGQESADLDVRKREGG